MKILVAEDEQYARESLVRQIRTYEKENEESWELIECANGKEALTLFLLHRPELVITDIRMPMADGIWLLEQIRKENAEVPVIILSAYSDFEYMRGALVQAASDYLLKPVSQEMLSQCLDKVLQKRRTQERRAMESGQDMVTKYLTRKLKDPAFRDFVAESLAKRLFPSWKLWIFYFAERKPDREAFLHRLEELCADPLWMKARFLVADDGTWILLGCGDLILPAEELAEEFHQMRIGISDRSDTFSALPEAFLQAKDRAAQNELRASKGAGNDHIVDWLKKYAKAHYQEDLTLRELSEKHLFMNQNYVSHLFSERQGVSFTVYLRKIRMQQAARLLQTGEYSVTEAAMMTGYNDTSQFIRAFRQEYGQTPKKYAQMSKNEDGNDHLSMRENQ